MNHIVNVSTDDMMKSLDAVIFAMESSIDVDSLDFCIDKISDLYQYDIVTSVKVFGDIVSSAYMLKENAVSKGDKKDYLLSIYDNVRAMTLGDNSVLSFVFRNRSDVVTEWAERTVINLDVWDKYCEKILSSGGEDISENSMLGAASKTKM